MSNEDRVIKVIREMIEAGQSTFKATDVADTIVSEDQTAGVDAGDGARIKWAAYAWAVLRTLAALGRVKLVRGRGASLVDTGAGLDGSSVGFLRSPDPIESVADQGGGGDVPGAGFREVLSHPYLFAVSEAHFQSLLEAIE